MPTRAPPVGLFDEPRREVLARLDPSEPRVAEGLAPIHDSASSYEFLPYGGERLGGLSIAVISRAGVGDPVLAALALWKVQACLGEGWPYAAWSLRTVRAAADGTYAADWARWREPVADPSSTRADEFVHSLRQRAQSVVTAEPPWLNQPCFSPSLERFPAAALALDFIRPDALALCLSDRWNDMIAIFSTVEHAYWVEWFTNA